MYEGYRVVALVPGGRRAMMRAGMPHLIAQVAIDEIRILLNTKDPEDVAHIQSLESAKVTVQRLPRGMNPGGMRKVSKIYENATDASTIYLKIDDDLVWFEPGAIDKVLAARLAYEKAFFISPMVINNTHCTHHLQRHRKLDGIKRYVKAMAAGFAWEEGPLCEALHRILLTHIQKRDVTSLHTPDFYLAHSRFSINFIAFFGRDMARFHGAIPEIWRFRPDDEEFLSVHAPVELGTYNVVIGDALVAHFSYGPQAEYMAKTDVIDAYQKIAETVTGPGPVSIAPVL